MIYKKDKARILKIIEEIIELEHDINPYKLELIKFLEKFINSNPEITIDKNFKENLRKTLIIKCNQLKNVRKIKQESKSNNIWKYILSFLGGIALTSLVIIPILGNSSIFDYSKNKETLSNFSKIIPSFMGGNEFPSKRNELSLKSLSPEKQINEDTELAEAATSKLESYAIDSSIETSLTNYIYVYNGKDLNINKEKVTVYKKNHPKKTAEIFEEKIKDIKLSNIDLNSFKNTNIQSMSLNENKDSGYFIYIDFENNIISIYKECNETKCNNMIKIEDIPSDKEIIDIAEKFLKSHGIDKKNLGYPTINKYWENNSEKIIPSIISINYPWEIDGIEVYDIYGNKNGTYVDIDLKDKSVSNVMDLNLSYFSSEKYDTASKEDVLELAKNGGLNNIYNQTTGNNLEIKLEKPEEIFVQIQVQKNNGQNEIFFVPAYKFPVVNPSNLKIDNFKENIIVPKAKYFMENIDKNNSIYR